MKRLLALVLILCLAALPALAEPAPAEEYTWYTHPTFNFSVAYPADWVLVDQTNLDDFLAETSSGNSPYAHLYAAVSPSAANIRNYDIALMVDPDTLTNINFLPQTIGLNMSAQDFIDNALPSVVEQLKVQFSGAEALNPGSLETMGENEYAALMLKYNMMGVDMVVSQFYIMNGPDLYTITFTSQLQFVMNDTEAMDALLTNILSSLTF